MELKDITTLVGTVGVPTALLFYVVKYLVSEVKALREEVAKARQESAQQAGQIGTTMAVLVRTIDMSDAERARVEEALTVKRKET